VREDIAAGRLVRMMADYEVVANSAVWAVYPSTKPVLPRLGALLDFLAKWFADADGEETVTDRRDSAAKVRREARNNITKPLQARAARA
jgi:hypothetical protein